MRDEDTSMGVDEGSKVRRTSGDDDGDAMLSVACGMDDVDARILSSVILGVDLTEVYSPVRVAAVAAKFGLRPGSSLDLTNGWNFSKSEHRRRALLKIKEEDPYCVIGSPPCTMFSMLQELTKAVKKDDPEWQRRHK